MLPTIANVNRRRGLTVAVLGALALMCVAGPPAAAGKKGKKVLARPIPVDSVPSAPMTLSRANEEWEGAHSQTRVPLPIKKGRNKQGWSKSDWLGAKGERHKMRVWVNDPQDLREIIPQGNVLVGANLICERWFVQNPKKGQGVTVDFRFANYDGALRLEFDARMDELDEIERFLRFNVLTVQRRSDRLEAPAAASPPPLAAGMTAAASGQGVLPPGGIRVVSAEARPSVVAPGDEIELLISYEVGDVARGGSPVVERRTLLRDGARITFFEDSIDRDAGRFTSTQKIRIPADAPPGAYSFRARIEAGDLSDEATTTFEVRR